MTKKVGAVISLIGIVAYGLFYYLGNYTDVLAKYASLDVDIVTLILAFIVIVGLLMIGSSSVFIYLLGAIVLFITGKHYLPVDDSINSYIGIAGVVLILIAIVMAVVDILKALFKKRRTSVIYKNPVPSSNSTTNQSNENKTNQN